MHDILDAIGALVNTNLIENCHRIPSKGSPKKVLLKLNHRKNSRPVLLNKKKLKQFESLNLLAGVKIYINESLCHTTKNDEQKKENFEIPSKFCPLRSVMDPKQ